MFETLCKFKASQQHDCYLTWSSSVHAVLKDSIQCDSLRNKRNAQGKLMRFWCSENARISGSKTDKFSFSQTGLYSQTSQATKLAKKLLT